MPTTSPTFHVSFEITVDDFVAYLRLLQLRLNTIGVVLGLVVMGIGATLAVLTLDAFTGVWTFAVGLILVIAAGTDFMDRWRVRRSAKSLIGSKASFKFDDEGIDAETVSGSGNVPWSSVTELKRNDRVLIIKRDRIPLVWIPLRAFSTAEDEEAFEFFIRAKIGR